MKTRVAFSLDSFEIGGTELNAVRTIERLDRQQYDVRVVCLRQDGPLLERVKALGIPITQFAIPSLVGPGALRSGIRLRAWLRRERIQVFHAHDIYSNIFAVPWARLAGVPAVIASRRWWTEVLRPEHTWLNRQAYRFAHRVLANSDAVGRLVANEGVDPSRIIVVPNFVDEAAFTPPTDTWLAERRAELGIVPGDTVIGVIANFHGIKDHASLLRAVAALLPSHPGVRVVLVGDGAERDNLTRLAEALGIRERVVFAGRRPQSPTFHWLFDLSVLCSRGEGFPNSIVEAMAAGRPVVATRVGGIPDAVADGVSGLLVPPGDPAALADGIARVLTDPHLARSLGASGTRLARQQFHSDAVLTRLGRFYGDMLGTDSLAVA